MENYYEYMELDMTASGEDITIRLDTLSSQENADQQKIREIKSILLNETARKIYDEKLINHILNKSKPSLSGLNPSAITQIVKLDNSVLHDKYIWVAIALFLFSIASDFIFGLNVNMVINIIVMLLTLVIFFMDWKLLEVHGKASFSKWWILFSPVYIFKRGKSTGAENKLFFIWMAIVILYVVIKAVFNSGTALLERSACDVVTDIYHSQFHQYSASCKNVTITQSSGKMHYGFAEISDGSTRDITVTERQGGDIYVTVE